MPMLPDMLIGAIEGAAWRDSAATLAAALGAGSVLLGLWNHRKVFAETTLVYAAWWSAAACAAIAAVEVARAILEVPSSLLSPLRFCAAALTFCPIISVLGSNYAGPSSIGATIGVNGFTNDAAGGGVVGENSGGGPMGALPGGAK